MISCHSTDVLLLLYLSKYIYPDIFIKKANLQCWGRYVNPSSPDDISSEHGAQSVEVSAGTRTISTGADGAQNERRERLTLRLTEAH